MFVQVYNENNWEELDYVSDDYLYINCSGCYEIGEKDMTTIRPKGRKDYQLIYFWRGKGLFYHNNEEIEVNAGEVFLFKPYEPHNYVYVGGMDTLVYWVHFTGSAVEDLLRENNLTSGVVYHVGICVEITEMFNNLINEIKYRKPAYNSLLNAFFLTLVSLVKRRIIEYRDELFSSYSTMLQPVIDDINKNYANNKTVEDYAEMCHLDKYYFIRCFKKHTGMTPYAYKIQVRMKNAKHLLSNTSMSIKEIAEMVGFSDQLYFSRTFKKYSRLTPSEYRRQSML